VDRGEFEGIGLTKKSRWVEWSKASSGGVGFWGEFFFRIFKLKMLGFMHFSRGLKVVKRCFLGALPIHICCRTYRLPTMHRVTDERTDDVMITTL